MRHGPAGRGSCLKTTCILLLQSITGAIARGVTAQAVGAGVWLGRWLLIEAHDDFRLLPTFEGISEIGTSSLSLFRTRLSSDSRKLIEDRINMKIRYYLISAVITFAAILMARAATSEKWVVTKSATSGICTVQPATSRPPLGNVLGTYDSKEAALKARDEFKKKGVCE